MSPDAPAALAHQFDDLAQQREADTLGMWIFLATEIMFFGGLFLLYTAYRIAYPTAFTEASHHLDVRLGAINTVVEIDPEKVADVLGAVEDKLGDQVDTDKLWEKMRDKEMEGVEGAMTDQIPSVDQMFKDLEDEVVSESDAEPPARSRAAAESSARADDDTANLRARARKIIDGNQS